MDIVLHLNSYHTSGIPRMIGFLRRKNLPRHVYTKIVSRFYNIVMNADTSFEKIRLIQECMAVIDRKVCGEKIYGYDKFVKIMAKGYLQREKRAIELVRHWVIFSSENPQCTTGKRRKIEEYNSYF